MVSISLRSLFGSASILILLVGCSGGSEDVDGSAGDSASSDLGGVGSDAEPDASAADAGIQEMDAAGDDAALIDAESSDAEAADAEMMDGTAADAACPGNMPTVERVGLDQVLAPVPIVDVACTPFHDGHIYCFGGQIGSGATDQIFDFDPIAQTVVVKTAVLPTGEYAMSCVEGVNDRIYCLAGAFSNPGAIYEYDPVADSITTKAAAVHEFFRFKCVAAPNDNIYCFGGGGSQSASVEIFEYNPIADAVTTRISEFPPRSQGLGCYPLPGGLIGCISQVPSAVVPEGRLRAFVYDPLNDLLTQTAAIFPDGRSYFDCAMMPTGNVLCAGGFLQSQSVYLDDLFEYDPAADSFTARPVTMPRTLYQHTMVLGADGYVHIIGGVEGIRFSELIFRYVPSCP